MKKENELLIGAGVLMVCSAIAGLVYAKIYNDLNKVYIQEVKRLKSETDFKFSKEFLKELKEELRELDNESTSVPSCPDCNSSDS